MAGQGLTQRVVVVMENGRDDVGEPWLDRVAHNEWWLRWRKWKGWCWRAMGGLGCTQRLVVVLEEVAGMVLKWHGWTGSHTTSGDCDGGSARDRVGVAWLGRVTQAVVVVMEEGPRMVLEWRGWAGSHTTRCGCDAGSARDGVGVGMVGQGRTQQWWLGGRVREVDRSHTTSGGCDGGSRGWIGSHTTSGGCVGGSGRDGVGVAWLDLPQGMVGWACGSPRG